MISAGRRLAIRALFASALVIAAAVTSSCAPKFNLNHTLSGSSLAQVGPATKLEFVTEPSASAGSGVAFSIQPVLEISDASGNTVASATSTVTLAAYTNATCTTPAPGTLSASMSATSGVASFSGVSYSGATGTTIYIGASSSGLTSACSIAISVTAGAPSKLVFTTEPADPSATAGVAFATQPVLTVEDAYGNVVSSASNSVQLKAYTDAACSTAGTGTMGATSNPVSASSGVSTFAGVNYTKSGIFYVGASSAGLASACSNPITVAAGPPSQIVWLTSYVAGYNADSCISTSVGVEDQYGNTATVTGSAVTVTLNAGGSAAYFSDSGCTSSMPTATIPVGQSNTGTFYFSDSTVESESQSATATGLTAAPTRNYPWVLLPVLSFSPTTFAAGQCVSFTITTQDAKGNARANAVSSAFTLKNPGTHSSFYSDNTCGTSILVSSMSIPAGQSSVTYYYEDTRAESLSMSVTGPYSGGVLLNWGGAAGSATVTATTAADLVLTGPTFAKPNTCYGPFSVTATDAYGNASTITGSALSVSLSSAGSTGFYSDSSCGSSESGVSIAVGSTSQMFYASDSDSSGTYMITGSGTGFISGTFNLSMYTGASSPLEQTAVGGAFTCVLINGGVKCWGDNTYGELGNGTTSSSLTPVPVTGLTSGVTSVIAARSSSTNSYGLPVAEFACALKMDNTVWCWGNGVYGELGNGLTSNSSTPVEVTVSGTPLSATQISANGVLACAVTTAGALYCWGDKTLGITDMPNTATPQLIQSSGAVYVATGESHVCIVETGGDLKCFGSNGYNDLGDNPSVASATPVQVYGLTSGVTNAGVSGLSSCAVVSGALNCWSTVGYGQNPSSSIPVAMSSPLNSGISSVIGGGEANDYFFALTTSGALYGWGGGCCGSNQDGILGAGNPNIQYSYASPYETFSSGVQAISVTNYGFSACAVVSGDLECWGDNAFGQSGTQTLGDSYSPTYPGSLE